MLHRLAAMTVTSLKVLAFWSRARVNACLFRLVPKVVSKVLGREHVQKLVV